MSNLLQVHGLCKAFGAVTVADELSFSLTAGEALGIIGPNGAGKTSLFNLLTGVIGRPDAGTIEFADQDVTNLDPAQRCHLGIARSFQIPHPFNGMTVYENALVGATHGARLDKHTAQQHCLAMLELTQLLNKANVLAGKLTLLERKRLELTRALCAKPKLLLLDEIAGGLTEHECEQLVTTIKEIRSSGVSIIWIEHIVHALLAIVDRLIVIDFGCKIAEGDPQATMASSEVQEIYLGIEVEV